MKKTLFCFLLIVFFYFNTNGQNQDPVYIILSSDLLEVNLYYPHKLSISSNQNISLSGMILAEETAIVATGTNSISIVPISVGSGFAARDGDGGGGTTVIKSKGTTAGRPPDPIIIYPNPVQTDLTFHVPDNLAIAYSIFDMNGILKKNLSLIPTNFGTIDVSGLPTATYILKLDMITGNYTTLQFIKN